MERYVIRFLPEYCATCLWPQDQNTEDAFGIPIQYYKVGLSAALTQSLEAFDAKVMGIIDWGDPAGESPMTVEEREMLYQEGRRLMAETIKELGSKFEVIDELDWIRPK